VDTQTLRALEIIGYYIAAFALSNIAARLIISAVLKYLITDYIGLQAKAETKVETKVETKNDPRNLGAYIGSVEQFMYTASVLLGRPEFIGVWLALKAVGEWRTRRDEVDVIGVPREYTIFLIGNALSVIAGVATALLIQRFFPTIPSSQLPQWRLPTV
jgi:hypothetical protein